MEFYFYPAKEDRFKTEAIDNYVRTLVFNKTSGKVEFSFIRKVSVWWKQTCKNNIESDHRIKGLKSGLKINHYEIYSWVVKNKNSLDLPSFTESGKL